MSAPNRKESKQDYIYSISDNFYVIRSWDTGIEATACACRQLWSDLALPVVLTAGQYSFDSVTRVSWWVGLSVSLPALIVFSVITLQHYTRMECCFRLICQLNDNELIVSLLSGTCHRGRQKLVGSVAFIPNVVGPCSWLVTLYVEWL